MDWINVVTNLGFPVGLVIAGAVYLNKHTPTFIKAWHEFTIALKDMSAAVAQNSAITVKHSEETVTVQQHLKKAIELLEEHHDNAIKIGEDVDTLKDLFIELAEQIQNLNEKGA